MTTRYFHFDKQHCIGSNNLPW